MMTLNQKKPCKPRLKPASAKSECGGSLVQFLPKLWSLQSLVIMQQSTENKVVLKHGRYSSNIKIFLHRNR